jgi:hypothetical protein
MGILCFVWPVTGNTVSTNLEIDTDSFSTLSNNGPCAVQCPDWRNHDPSKLAHGDQCAGGLNALRVSGSCAVDHTRRQS